MSSLRGGELPAFPQSPGLKPPSLMVYVRTEVHTVWTAHMFWRKIMNAERYIKVLDVFLPRQTHILQLLQQQGNQEEN